MVASATSGLPITFSSAGACFNNGATYTISSVKELAGNDEPGGERQIHSSANGHRNHNGSGGDCADGERNRALHCELPDHLHGIRNHQRQHYPNHHGVTGHGLHDQRHHRHDGERYRDVMVTAKWAADDVYGAATAKAATTAEKVASVVTWATPVPITYGTALSATQLNATASEAGKFVYTPASGKVLAVGTYTLSVKFTPTTTSGYTTVTATTVSLVVDQANTTTTITSTSLNPSIVGQLITVHFNVASPGKATGSVTISASSGETCSGTLTAAGTGSCKLGLGTAGSITLTATYGGDANNNGSVSAGFTQIVN